MEQLSEEQYNDSFCYSEILTREFLQPYLFKNPPWGFNGLGYLVYRRTYSRKINGQDFEEWWQTIARCINGAQKIGAGYTREEAERLFDLIFNLKCNFSGRMLWQLGTSTVDRFGLASLVACWFVAMRDVEDFCFVFEHLMLGGGVGFSVKRENVHELPRVKRGVVIRHEKTNDADFIVPDSRQGWVELLRKVLRSCFETGKSFTYSTILVRGSGEPIRGFGGTASGPQILIEGMTKIIFLLKEREGKKLRSIDVLDINDIIGSVVVAGNVRRSALACTGDPDDYLFLRAKNWSLGTIPNWRSMSNNSIEADTFKHISEEVWDNGYILDPKTKSAKGEAYGFVNMPLCQKYGRLGEEKKDNAEGLNPCFEITLADGEPCNLSDLYLNNIESEEELFDCARLLYKTQKAVCTLPTISDKTDRIVKKNRRIGVGVTGICQSLGKVDWLDSCYRKLREFDKIWSAARGWPESIKLTTIKPSGSVSLLSGSTAGIHPAFSQFFIRRVRIASGDALVNLCRESGYKTEYVKRFDGTDDHSTMVVEFPCQFSPDTLFSKDMGAIEQMELTKKLQTVWSDNSISVTIYYKMEELPAIKEWMKNNYEKGCKTLSFSLHSEHGFQQPPYEEIDEETYLRLSATIKPIQVNQNIPNELLEGLECAGGACPVR